MFELPTLKYAYVDLEPYVDAKTIEIHYEKHHAAYIANLNKVMQENKDLFADSIEAILANLAKLPENIRTAVRNNGGGHYNHSLYWQLMGTKVKTAPEGELADLINKDFGDLTNFKAKMNDAGLARFGSGWVWLTFTGGQLNITTTPNQDSPIMEGTKPLIGIDVWEHAYYLKYQNKRAEYLQAWWNTLDWREVEETLKTLG